MTTKAFADALKLYELSQKTLEHAIESLPELRQFHRDSKDKPCGWTVEDDEIVWEDKPDMHVRTVGLEQHCAYDPEENKGYTDGYDDYSEDGPTYVHCDRCGMNFQPRSDMDWD